MPPSRILVVEDDAKVAGLIRLYLENEGFAVTVASDGREALALARAGPPPSLVVLDVLLPHVDGFEVCRRLRAESDIPIIVVTARTTEDDRLEGLKLGADDYVSKPFSPRELVLRVQAVLRRVPSEAPAGPPLERAGVLVDPAKHEVRVRGELVDLTPREFRLLHALARSPGRAFTREELVERALGRDYAGLERTIDVHVKNLRQKLERDASTPSLIETVHGVGYRFRGGDESLRARLLLSIALVAAIAVAASALLSGRIVTSEFQRFTTTGRAPDLKPLADALARDAAARGSLAGADSLLRVRARSIGRELALVGRDGVVRAASAPILTGTRFRFGAGGRVDILGARRGDRSEAQLGLELVNPPSAPVAGASGAVIGTLYALPPIERGGPLAPRFLETVNRGLAIAAIVALALGLALGWLLSRRILGPIEALTSAAKRLERGDLAARVEPRGDDEIATLSRAFNEMAESLSNTERQRRQLTSDVAHELRTPLTNLRAQIEAIEDGLARPDAAVLRSLHEEVILLARLADDLQELTLTESRALRLDREALPVAPALESAATALRARANERGVALSVEPAPGLVVDADPGRLAQVLRNLLENAVGHTPSGGVVTMSAHAEGARVAIEVSDTGDGIEPEHLPNVFERFYRADPSRSRASGGAGLGLAIVRSLVEAHGGEVRIASEIGRGTRVTLYFPAVPGQ